MIKQKIAYMTVDDSPTSYTIDKMDILLKNKIPAIWYCKGKELEQNIDVGIYLLKNNFVIGNHAYNHKPFSILTLDQAIEEINKTDKVIKRIYDAAGKKHIKTFRFPYFDKGGGQDIFKKYSEAEKKHINDIQNVLKDLNYTQPKFNGINYKWFNDLKLHNDYIDTYWTYHIMEWKFTRNNISQEEILGWIDKDQPENQFGLNSSISNEIIVIHDHVETTDFFSEIIDKLLTKNFIWSLPEF